MMDKAPKLTEEQLRVELRGMLGWHAGRKVMLKTLAARFGVSEAYLSQVMNGHKGIGPKLAAAMGYERVVCVPGFRPISEGAA